MQINRDDLAAAVKANLLNDEQAQQLWSFWQKAHEDVPSFRFAHVLYYLGGIMAIAAITLFVTQAWSTLRGWPLFFLSLLFFALGLLLTHHFINKKLTIPAGIMATFSLAVVPLAIYNLQSWFGLLPSAVVDYASFHAWISWVWVPMEIITLMVGLILFYIYDFPFLLFPVAVILWYMSMDLWTLMVGINHFSFNDRAQFTLIFGLFMIAYAMYLDFKYNDNYKDYAFWLYIFGVITFWGGLSCLDSTSELGRFIYCMINLAMIFIGVILNRRVFTVFGAIGLFGYLGHLAFSIFPYSLAFPVVLIFLGILIILIATRWARMEQRILQVCGPYLPKKILKDR